MSGHGENRTDTDAETVVSGPGDASTVAGKTHTASRGESTDPLIGIEVKGLTVTALLGEGAFGKVYRGHDPNLGRDVAIKFLKGGVDTQRRTLFEREAKAIAKLSQHPNIVTIHQWGEYQGMQFFVLEYIDSSAEKLLELNPTGLDLPTALRILADCAEALQEAHENGILHRDIKPANILIEGKGKRAKLADFGLARIPEASGSFTLDRLISGSPPYMSPEQAGGEPVDERTDIYSLGVTLYQMLCGRLPFEGDTPTAVIDKVRANDRVSLRERRPDLPEGICHLVEKATAFQQSNRYQTAGDFANQLRVALRALEHSGQVPEPGDAATVLAVKPGPSRPILLFAIAGVIVVLGIVGVLIWAMRPGGETQTAAAAENNAAAPQEAATPPPAAEIVEPPENASATPEAIVEYYCTRWIQADYAAMYGALAKSQRDTIRPDHFGSDVQKVAQRTGNPVDWKIVNHAASQPGGDHVTVEISYANNPPGALTKDVWVVETEKGWRLGSGSLSEFQRNQFGPGF